MLHERASTRHRDGGAACPRRSSGGRHPVAVEAERARAPAAARSRPRRRPGRRRRARRGRCGRRPGRRRGSSASRRPRPSRSRGTITHSPLSRPAPRSIDRASPVAPSMRTSAATEVVASVDGPHAPTPSPTSWRRPTTRSSTRGNSSGTSLSCCSSTRPVAVSSVQRHSCGVASSGPSGLPANMRLVAHDVEHDAVAVVERVERVEHVARRRPRTSARRSPARRAARARPAPRGSSFHAYGKRDAVHRAVEVERDGQVVDDHPALGDRAVVDHRPAVDLDRLDLADEAVGADHDVLQVRAAPSGRRWRAATPVAGSTFGWAV